MLNARSIALLIPLFSVEASAMDGKHESGTIQIENSLVRLVLEERDGAYGEAYYAAWNGAWTMMLAGGSSLRPDVLARSDGRDVRIAMTGATVIRERPGVRAVRLEGSAGPLTVRKTIELREHEPFARVAVAMTVSGSAVIAFLQSTYCFVPDGRRYAEIKPLDFIFSPQLRPEPAHVIADHIFRSPALMLQKANRLAALVPDLQSIDQEGRLLRSTADLQVETADAPFFSFGLQNWLPEPYRLRNTHVYYGSDDSLAVVLTDTTVSYAFLLWLNSDAPPRRGYRDIVRYFWREYGEKNIQKEKGPQAEPFSRYIRKAWYEFVPQVALDVVYRGRAVTLLRQARLAWSNSMHKEADNDAWFNVWFNSLRTAYGMHLHGEVAPDSALIERARNVLTLALLAPQKEGIAPSIFYFDSTGGHWVADHAWGGIADGRYYAMFHNAWTNYWLLQWIDRAPDREQEILSFTRSFADFLLGQQRPSGVIPSWYHPETLEPAQQLRDDNAETAGAALFLAEFSARTKETRYLDAARKAMDYIINDVLPYHRWFDYETFFSCSRKPLSFFDRFTQQYPQNTLSMHQAAEACLALHRLTGDEMYRARGEEILDYLCLYQQVWSPQWLSCELFGGFGVQNTDAEWSDARQGYFAVTLMRYYELTGKREYFERGVAALRAMFSLFESPDSPRTAENYAHSGYDRPAGVTGLHWGTGSSVVSIHLIGRRYGDAYVNVAGQWGVGIDGCRIPRVVVEGRTITVDLLDNVAAPRTIKLKFDRMPDKSYEIVINNKPLGSFETAHLQQGIDVAI